MFLSCHSCELHRWGEGCKCSLQGNTFSIFLGEDLWSLSRWSWSQRGICGAAWRRRKFSDGGNVKTMLTAAQKDFSGVEETICFKFLSSSKPDQPCSLLSIPLYRQVILKRCIKKKVSCPSRKITRGAWDLAPAVKLDGFTIWQNYHCFLSQASWKPKNVKTFYDHWPGIWTTYMWWFENETLNYMHSSKAEKGHLKEE